MIRSKISWLVLPVFLMAMLSGMAGQGNDAERDTMKGLAGVGILVADLPEGLVQAGLTAEMVRADIETQLKKAGIRVYTDEERKKAIGRPTLLVAVDWAVWKNKGLFAASIDLELCQEVVVMSNRQRVWNTTWSTGAMYGGPLAEMEPVRARIRELVDEFAKDYLAANPKGSTP